MIEEKKIIQRQIAIEASDWIRAECIAKNATFPTCRAQVFPRIIKLGLDEAERLQKEEISK